MLIDIQFFSDAETPEKNALIQRVATKAKCTWYQEHIGKVSPELKVSINEASGVQLSQKLAFWARNFANDEMCPCKAQYAVIEADCPEIRRLIAAQFGGIPVYLRNEIPAAA